MNFNRKKDTECSHATDAEICLPLEILQNIAKKNDIQPNASPEKLLKDLKSQTNCDTQVCVVEKTINDNSILEEYFKPKGPKNTFAWLSNFDIDNVLKQLAKKHPDFLHIYFHMRDFEKNPIVGENGITLSNLCFHTHYKEGKKTFGVVFNTDKSTGKGEHWLAVFGDFRDPKNCTIEYFDSAGKAPMPEVNSWMAKASVEWGKKFECPVQPLAVSCMIYQNDSHSCGVYALYYIMSRLEGVPNKDFQKPSVNDEMMHQFRKYLFRE